MQGPALTYDTKSLTDILSLVLALGEIHHWGNTTYRDWFMEVVKGIDDGYDYSAQRTVDDSEDDSDVG